MAQMKKEIIKQLKDYTIVTLMYNSDFSKNKSIYNYYFYLQITPLSINEYLIDYGSYSDIGNFNLLKSLNFINILFDEKQLKNLISQYDFNFVQFEYSEDIYFQYYLKDDLFIKIN